VDLPTYTNIWRIEKRLYKLYDFRLPAPLQSRGLACSPESQFPMSFPYCDWLPLTTTWYGCTYCHQECSLADDPAGH